MIRVCHVTSVHPAKDARIFYKECVSLSKMYEVYLIAPDVQDEIADGVHIVGVKLPKNRIKRVMGLKVIYEKALSIDASIYHFHDPELMKVGLKIQKRGKKIIFDSHEDIPRQILTKDYLPSWIRKPISLFYEVYEKMNLSRYDALISVTPFIVERLKKINPLTVMITNFPTISQSSEPQVVKNGGGIFVLLAA